MSTVLSVLYNDIDPTTYAGVQLSTESETVVFNTGNPTHDFLTASMVAHHAGGDVLCSSSVDHFGSDGGDLHDETASDEEIESARAAAIKYLAK